MKAILEKYHQLIWNNSSTNIILIYLSSVYYWSIGCSTYCNTWSVWGKTVFGIIGACRAGLPLFVGKLMRYINHFAVSITSKQTDSLRMVTFLCRTSALIELMGKKEEKKKKRRQNKCELLLQFTNCFPLPQKEDRVG